MRQGHVGKGVFVDDVGRDVLVGKVDVKQAVRREIPFVRRAEIGGAVRLQVGIATFADEELLIRRIVAVEAVLDLTRHVGKGRTRHDLGDRETQHHVVGQVIVRVERRQDVVIALVDRDHLFVPRIVVHGRTIGLLVFALGVTDAGVAVPLARAEIDLGIGVVDDFAGVPQVPGITIIAGGVARALVGDRILRHRSLGHADEGFQIAGRTQTVDQSRIAEIGLEVGHRAGDVERRVVEVRRVDRQVLLVLDPEQDFVDRTPFDFALEIELGIVELVERHGGLHEAGLVALLAGGEQRRIGRRLVEGQRSARRRHRPAARIRAVEAQIVFGVGTARGLGFADRAGDRPGARRPAAIQVQALGVDDGALVVFVLTNGEGAGTARDARRIGRHRAHLDRIQVAALSVQNRVAWIVVMAVKGA